MEFVFSVFFPRVTDQFQEQYNVPIQLLEYGSIRARTLVDNEQLDVAMANMDFYKYKCPVCNKQFKEGDDIVVCPECGTPHHRECYEQEEHCFYQDKHSQNFSFENDQPDSSDDFEADKESGTDNEVICKICGHPNDKTLFYCEHCGAPLLKDNQPENDSVNGNNNVPPDMNGFPFGQNPQNGGIPFIAFDPMAGFKADEKMADNVTAGEVSKLVGKNTNYFMRVFGSILRTNKSRFSFVSAILPGAYMLYRKMYAIGIVISVIVVGLLAGTLIIQTTPEFTEAYNIYMDNYSAILQSGYSGANVGDLFAGMSSTNLLYFAVPYILGAIRFAIMLICGFRTNRMYFKHCIKKISSIKNYASSFDKESDEEAATTKSKINEQIENKGGVNLAIAVVATFVFLAIAYMALFV